MLRRQLAAQRTIVFGISSVLFLAACAAPRASYSPRVQSGMRVVDLTHTLNSDFPFIPVPGITFPFASTPIATIEKNGVAANKWSIHEHIGTQIDAPSHFVAGGMSLEQFPARSLIAPLAIIDLRERAARAPDTTVTVADILAWEKAHGRLPDGAAVFMYSGWEDRVHDAKAFINADATNTMHFPGFSPEAAEFLLKERQVVGVGVDTLSFDPGRDHTYRTHKAWLSGGAKWAVECVANLALVPAAGATVYVGASKVEGATGGPVRLIAMWTPEDVAPNDIFRPIVHVHQGGEKDAFANSYLVETENGIVLVDAPMTVAQGIVLRARRAALSKPLLAILLTHPHPDHYGGVATVRDTTEVPFVAGEAADRILRRDDAAKGEALKRAGIGWPERRTFPTRTLKNGESLTLDGVRFVLRELGPGESHADAMWIMEVAGRPVGAFIGDLAMRGVHPFLADGHSSAWLQALDRIAGEIRAIPRLYPGHGPPGGADLVAWTKAYLLAYRSSLLELLAGAATLTAPQKEELTRRMAVLVPGGRLVNFVPRGADAVAAEILQEGNRR